MAVLFEKTKLLTDKQFHYCPGCNHGIIHRLVAEVIDEMNLDGKVIGVAPVGCSVFAYDYFNCDMYEAAHGRAPAVATGVKRAVGPDTMVFTYQGDGDLASIGPHHPDRSEDHHLPLWPRRGLVRRPHQDERDAGRRAQLLLH